MNQTLNKGQNNKENRQLIHQHIDINNQHMHTATNIEQFFDSIERTRCCVMMQKERLDFFS